jgi:mannose-6-phosphate isomerase-like protein (cupin superfamily)
VSAEQVLGPRDGEALQISPALGVRFMIEGARTDGAFALIEHPLAPRGLGSPLHRHSREDEYSYVLEGRVGVQLGDEVVEAGPGELVSKPRGQWHAFWNPGEEPARLLEVISPAGFEEYFRELAPILAPVREGTGPPDVAALAAVWEKYGLEMDPASQDELRQRHSLTR